jgi:hypothetical protein
MLLIVDPDFVFLAWKGYGSASSGWMSVLLLPRGVEVRGPEDWGLAFETARYVFGLVSATPLGDVNLSADGF